MCKKDVGCLANKVSLVQERREEALTQKGRGLLAPKPGRLPPALKKQKK